ncbi:hypothetical protein K469DRAFT_294243 [Zopfia rhizophila CBS 207.26]|uniref:Uncharacterized protein n=1 Tax=Zopfia rhizophila CBS 207.26 TaxID=1314779 RepID=A0A6A6DLV5_9PEZI|nr:hypothetical protein K469DRAFT_294243 [Zopfia rhizophila CBS 207.26]
MNIVVIEPVTISVEVTLEESTPHTFLVQAPSQAYKNIFSETLSLYNLVFVDSASLDVLSQDLPYVCVLTALPEVGKSDGLTREHFRELQPGQPFKITEVIEE